VVPTRKLAVVTAVDHVAGHVGDAPVHVPQHPFLRYKPSGARENGSALNVIPMAVTVNDITHGHARKTLVELSLEPLREIGSERIGQNNSFRSDQKERIPKPVLRAIEVASKANNFPLRSGLRAGLSG
jgi:hypothetical protein